MKQHRLVLADIFRTHQKDFLARWNHVLSRPRGGLQMGVAQQDLNGAEIDTGFE